MGKGKSVAQVVGFIMYLGLSFEMGKSVYGVFQRQGFSQKQDDEKSILSLRDIDKLYQRGYNLDIMENR